MKVPFSRFLILTVAATLLITQASAQVVDIPDPNLKQVIREALYLPDGLPITQQEMLGLIEFDAGGDRGIVDLTGLEYATNLRFIKLYHNPITDISVFAHFTKLEGFNLWGCQVADLSPLQNLKRLRRISLGSNRVSDVSPLAGLSKLFVLELTSNQISDISPLAELANLTSLELDDNNIVDFSPIANIINLKELTISDNPGSDFSSLQTLNLIDFRYDEPCDIEPLLPPVRDRIENRGFPSVFAAFGGVGWSPVENRPDLSDEAQIALHDLHFSPTFKLVWDVTETEPTRGVATQYTGDFTRAREMRQRRLDLNPNMVFLRGISMFDHSTLDVFPPNSDLWLRGANNQVIQNDYDQYMIDIMNPKVQDLLAKRIIAVARCGVYDGVFMDQFLNNGTGFGGRYLFRVTDEEITQALVNIFQAVRAQVRDDFLILINANETKPTRFAELINGTFMETFKDHPRGYSHDWLQVLESTLSWAEANLREPQINCLEAQGMSIEPPDGPNNLRGMRLITTLSLTHSDGYTLYTDGVRDLGGPHHHHLWYDFWDADLGQPIGPKAQQYKNVDGLFIRQFTKGWAVYNRSGKAPKTISLPEFGDGSLQWEKWYYSPASQFRW